MQGFKIQYSQICEYLGILGNIPRSDPNTGLATVVHFILKFLETEQICNSSQAPYR